MKVSRFFVLSIVVLLLIVGLTVSANAALVDNGDGTVTHIRNDGSILMWLEDANTAYTSGYCTTPGNCVYTTAGNMHWTQANDWITYLNNNNYLGYNDWRLPEVLPVNGISYTDGEWPVYDGSSDLAYNISAPDSAYPESTASEMAYMWYTELGNLGSYDTSGNNQGATFYTGPFDNIQNERYWSGNDYVEDSLAYAFDFQMGYQGANFKIGSEPNSWAVRSAGVVPEPISSTLFLIGGATLGFRRFRKKFKK